MPAVVALPEPMATRTKSIRLPWLWARSCLALCASKEQRYATPPVIPRLVAGNWNMAPLSPAATRLKFWPRPIVSMILRSERSSENPGDWGGRHWLLGRWQIGIGRRGGYAGGATQLCRGGCRKWAALADGK